jgi:sulfide:quinone oxidoreductase
MQMAINILILGDGIGGIVTANLLLKKAKKKNLSLNIKLVGNSPMHTYQPGMLFLPFQKSGYKKLADLQKPTANFIASDIEYLCETITSIDTDKRQVTTEKQTLSYDWLVLGLGCRTVIDEIDGLQEQWGAIWWLMWLISPSSAQWHRWSSPAWQIITSANGVSEIKQKSPW